MKQIRWKRASAGVVVIAAALVMVACGNPDVTPLVHSLVVFNEKDAAGEGKLMGVKETNTDTVVIPPDRYQNIKADPPFIICTKKEGDVDMQWVYRLNGEPVGRFEYFSHWKQAVAPEQTAGSPAPDFFLGVNFKRRFYYFPKTEIAVQTTEIYDEAPTCLLPMDGNEWKAIAYDGELLLSLPWEAHVVHDRSTQRLYWMKEEQGHSSAVDILSGQVIGDWQVPQGAEVRTWPGLTMLRM